MGPAVVIIIVGPFVLGLAVVAMWLASVISRRYLPNSRAGARRILVLVVFLTGPVGMTGVLWLPPLLAALTSDGHRFERVFGQSPSNAITLDATQHKRSNDFEQIVVRFSGSPATILDLVAGWEEIDENRLPSPGYGWDALSTCPHKVAFRHSDGRSLPTKSWALLCLSNGAGVGALSWIS
ncbi:hypothetical protein [Parvularcula dongshanensis]|uniref:Uncharacterized protein n=1 Tax=Parvularcula dongshanensis TaxID=1173995 RepID=A0A840I0Z3_9PROT|nr:hypothetical protein [Parvularcula dongshanensis]MBB4658015.1 hypothetical protein [Parvularcula dongshanensis]